MVINLRKTSDIHHNPWLIFTGCLLDFYWKVTVHCIDVHTAPFRFQLHTDHPQLASQLALLYPADVMRPASTQDFVDFQIDFRRRWSGFSRPYHFRLGNEHFRMADAHDSLACVEWGFNWCIATFQSHYLCIHAGVLEKNGITLIMPAPPGSGKSTLCALLMQHGWRLLSDEHCLVDPHSGDIVPCVRPISLKNTSIDVLQARLGAASGIQAIVRNTFKGTIGYMQPSARSWQQATQTAKATYVVLPKYDATPSALHVAAIAQAPLFMQLAANSFNYAQMGERGFRVMRQLVASVVGFEFRYHDADEAIAFMDSLP